MWTEYFTYVYLMQMKDLFLAHPPDLCLFNLYAGLVSYFPSQKVPLVCMYFFGSFTTGWGKGGEAGRSGKGI
jgi:hypothetical protein